VVKLQRVHGGCLGVQSLRRTWLSCDKLRGAAQRAVIRRSPRSGNRPGLISWKHLRVQGTQGTETSKYLQERKETSTPPVAASERGSAQTGAVSSLRALLCRGCGIHRSIRNRPRKLPNTFLDQRHGKAGRRG